MLMVVWTLLSHKIHRGCENGAVFCVMKIKCRTGRQKFHKMACMLQNKINAAGTPMRVEKTYVLITLF